MQLMKKSKLPKQNLQLLYKRIIKPKLKLQILMMLRPEP